jgi:hypothetical protein
MGQRSKVDLYGLLDRIIKLHTGEEGGSPKTIEEIEIILRGEGYDISRESIRRKLKSSKEVAAVYQKSLEEAKILLDAVRNNPNTDVVEVTNSLLAHRLFEFAKSVEELNFDDPSEFVWSVNKLSDAQVKVAKLRLDFQKGFEAAKKEIMQKVSAELSRQPEIKGRLVNIIEGIRAEQK